GRPASATGEVERPDVRGRAPITDLMDTRPHSTAFLEPDTEPGDRAPARSSYGGTRPRGWPPGLEGASVAGYEVLEEIGRGGMGVVYKARHRRMNRLVALKVIDKEHLGSAVAVQRFYREVQAAAQLSHPNIVMAYDAGELGQTHYFAMEYV